LTSYQRRTARREVGVGGGQRLPPPETLTRVKGPATAGTWFSKNGVARAGDGSTESLPAQRPRRPGRRGRPRYFLLRFFSAFAFTLPPTNSIRIHLSSPFSFHS